MTNSNLEPPFSAASEMREANSAELNSLPSMQSAILYALSDSCFINSAAGAVSGSLISTRQKRESRFYTLAAGVP